MPTLTIDETEITVPDGVTVLQACEAAGVEIPRFCYHDRLATAARYAKKGKFDGFTSTLLYSRFQKHDQIRSIGEAVGKSVGVPFHYRDFREGWRAGIEESRRLGMYRQQYCGCIYSEKERYYRKSAGKAERSADPKNRQSS
jgi:hypothetical protein